MTYLVLVSAPDRTSLVAEMSRVVGYIDRVHDVSMADIAYTCSLAHGESVIAIIAEDVAALRARLVSARDRLMSPSVKRLRDRSGTYYFDEHLLGEGKGKLAFAYPGVTSYYPDMVRDLAILYPSCRDAFDELEEALVQQGGEFVPSSFVFPPATYYRHDADIFSSGAYAQALVSIYAACAALTRLMTVCNVRPDGIVGVAGGDLAAMMCSGAAGDHPPRPDRVRVVREIYGIVDKAVDHAGLPEVAMISVLLRHPGEIDDLVKTFPADKVTLAVDFSPRQKTYCVTPDYEETALAAFASAGVRAVKLDLNRPFNTPLCEKLVPAIKKFASGWMKRDPAVDLYSCATAARLPASKRVARSDLAERWAKPVRFEETIRSMYADGYRVFLEVGPRGLMTRAVEDTLKGEPHAAIALNSIHRRGLLQVQHAVAQLAALGAKLDVSGIFVGTGMRRLDFDAPIASEVRHDSEMRLSRAFPRMTLLSSDTMLSGATFLAEPKGRGAKAAARAAALAQRARLQRQFDFGAMSPLISDADTVESSPGVSAEIVKTFKISELPFLGDFSIGSSQLSYSDPNLKGMVSLALPVAAEIMAELAQQVVPNRVLVAIQDLLCRRLVMFKRGMLKLFVKAERAPTANPAEIAVKVQIREDAPNGAYTWPAVEATFVLAEELPGGVPSSVDALSRPRSVHWSGRDIYPLRLCYGKRLRGIQFVEAWSESGLDYEVTVPPLADNVAVTRFPVWTVNPLLLATVTSGFALWRSHERFAGAFSFPFRMRRLDVFGAMPDEGASLNCYLRLTGVTPKSQVSDVFVTDGNGMELMRITGWEELTERVPAEYCDLILQPAITFLTEAVDPEFLGGPATEISSAFITDIPYPIFERNEELWLKTLSHIILNASERREFAAMTGSTSRRTEWLFGRVAAKEAVRRFLKDNYQARWSDADVQIWPDDSGKPHALGAWSDYLTTKIDIAIAHTSQFVVAIAAANARVGVDVESCNRDLSEEFTNGVFTPEELDLATLAANSSQAVIRFWCAKEAVSKALGTGIRYSPREMTVTAYQPDTGKLTMRLEGAWVEAFSAFRGRDINVVSRVMRDHAFAFCFIPASFFDESLVGNTQMKTPEGGADK